VSLVHMFHSFLPWPSPYRSPLPPTPTHPRPFLPCQRRQALLNDVRMASGRVLLFVDEIHMLIHAGATEGGLNAANLLKPALARGELRLIGATTVEEYRKHIESDAAFARRFQVSSEFESSSSEHELGSIVI
jgi:hypothetical protein